MRLCYGWSKHPVKLSPERRYKPEEVMEQLSSSVHVQAGASGRRKDESKKSPLSTRPLWMQVDSEYVRLYGTAELWLACRLAVIHHNSLDCNAPPDDGWYAETAAMEAQSRSQCKGGVMIDGHLLEASSEGEEWEGVIGK